MGRAAVKLKKPAKTRMIHVRLDPDLHRRLRLVVAAEDTSVQDWVARAIKKAVAKKWPNIATEDDE